MAVKVLRVFQEFTSAGYVPMPIAGNIDYGVTVANTFPATTPATFQTDDPDIEVDVTEVTDFYVWIRSHGTAWNYLYTRNVRVYPDSPTINNVVMGIIIARLTDAVPYTGATQDTDLGEFGLKAGWLGLDLTPTNTPTDVGTISWDDQDGTANLVLKGGNVNLQIGQEQVTRVVNKTGASLLEANYQAVRISGAQGNRLKVSLAQANNDANSADTIGLVTETIANNEEGFVTTSGLVKGINTTGSLQSETWVDGDVLYLSGTTAGMITNVKPQAPTHTVIIGYVVRAHATQGQIYVKVDNGYELDELHNVRITTPTDKDFLIYDGTNQYWKNRDLFGTTGYLPVYDTTSLLKDSIIYTDGAAIGIGTNVLQSGAVATFGDVAHFTENISLADSKGIVSGGVNMLSRNNLNNQIIIGADGGINDNVAFYAGDLERMRLLANGRLAINKTTASYQVDVQGDVNVSGAFRVNGTIIPNGTVTSVAMSVPTGLVISGSPITSSGTLAVTYAVNYGIPTLTKQSDWDDAYTWVTNFPDQLGNAGKFLTTNGSALSWASLVTGVSSVFGRTGAVVAQSGDYTTAQVTESGNLYYTDARARASLSFVAGSGAYNSTTGVITIPTNTNQLTNGASFITLASLSASAPLSYNSGTGAFSISQASGSTNGFLSSTDWNTFNNKQNALTNPVTGTGTTNYLPKFTGSTSIGNSLVFDNGTNVGIGTTTPDEILTLNRASSLYARIVNTSNSVSTYWGVNGTEIYFGSSSNSPVTFYSNSTERMRITSAGNVGIGISAPSYLLDVNGMSRFGALITNAANGAGGQEALRIYNNNGYIGFFDNTNTTRSSYIQGNTTDLTLSTSLANPILFYTSNTEKMRLTASGNLGLNVTPSAWSVLNVLQINNAAFGGLGNNAYMTGNAYYDGSSWRYIASSTATLYAQQVGTHVWYNAVSGTAGGAISYNQAMTLNSSGNLGLGVTPSAWDTVTPVFQIGTASFYGYSTQARLSANYYYGSGDKYVTNGYATSYLQSSGTHSWFTAGNNTTGAGTAISFTQAMTLDASGRLFIGLTSGYSNGVTIKGASDDYSLTLAQSNASNAGWGQWADTGGNYKLSRYGGGAYSSPALTITLAGAATFSSSVTASGIINGTTSQFTAGGTAINTIYASGPSTFGVSSSDAIYLRRYGVGEYQFQTVSGGASGGNLSLQSYGGNVGIGTTSPSHKLDVNASGNTARLQGGTATQPNLRIQSAIYPSIDFISDDTNSANRNWKIASVYNQYGMFEITSSTTAGGTDYTSRLAITNTGNVGIGTTSPTNGLLVINSTSATGVRFALESSGTMNGIVALGNNAISGLSTTDMALWTRGVMAFETGASGEKMRITSGGQIYMGNSAGDGYRLQIFGTNQAGSTFGQTYIGVAAYSQWVNSSGAFVMGLDGASGTTERMRITSGGDVNIGSSPSTGYKFNVRNASGNYISFWSPTIAGNAVNGILSHNGGGFNSQVAMGYNASLHVFNGEVTGGGLVQVAGDVNISGAFKINGTAIGTGGGGVSGSGSTNYVAKWSAGTSLTNSNITDNGTTITLYHNTGSGNVSFTYNNTTWGTGVNMWNSNVYPYGVNAGGIYFSVSGTQRMYLKSNGTLLYTANGNLDIIGNTTSGGSSIVRLDSTTGIGYNAETVHVFYTSLSEVARFNGAGEFLIGTSTDNGAYKLQVNSQIWATNATIATSDARLKDNIQDISNALSVIMGLKPRTFTYKQDKGYNFGKFTNTGFIAQEIKESMTGLNYLDSIVLECGNYYGVAYEKFIPILTKGIQEQQEIIERLEEKIRVLESNVN